MKFTINNIPPIKKAEVQLDGLTVLCGESGSGKTVAATVIYGFLHQWRGLLHNVLQPQVEEKLRDGDIDLKEMFDGKLLEGYYDKIAQAYKDTLADVLATSGKRVAKASVKFRPTLAADLRGSVFHRLVNNSLTICKEAGDTKLLTIHADDCGTSALAFFVASAIADIVFAPHLPSVHMSSAERTGAVIFADELACARGKILEFVRTDPVAGMKMLSEKALTCYPIPVTHGVDFVREFSSLDKLTGALAEDHPEILKEFHELLGGSFGVRNERSLVFADSAGNVISMNEASGKVRALADIGVYLHTKAKAGDVLIIDEPERSLGEKDQKRFAALLKKLVDAGIKVLLATNSKPFIDVADTKVCLGN